MRFDRVVYKRRSVRIYDGKQILNKDIKAIIEAGIWALSGLNNQPWKFKVLKDMTTIKKNCRFYKICTYYKKRTSIYLRFFR